MHVMFASRSCEKPPGPVISTEVEGRAESFGDPSQTHYFAFGVPDTERSGEPGMEICEREVPFHSLPEVSTTLALRST